MTLRIVWLLSYISILRKPYIDKYITCQVTECIKRWKWPQILWFYITHLWALLKSDVKIATCPDVWDVLTRDLYMAQSYFGVHAEITWSMGPTCGHTSSRVREEWNSKAAHWPRRSLSKLQSACLDQAKYVENKYLPFIGSSWMHYWCCSILPRETRAGQSANPPFYVLFAPKMLLSLAVLRCRCRSAHDDDRCGPFCAHFKISKTGLEPGARWVKRTKSLAWKEICYQEFCHFQWISDTTLRSLLFFEDRYIHCTMPGVQCTCIPM